MDSSIIYRFFLVLFIFTTSQVNAIEFKGKFIQGHFILGKTNPQAKVLVGKKEVKVSQDGFFVFGIDRDRKFDLTFTKIENNKKTKIIKKILKRKYNHHARYCENTHNKSTWSQFSFQFLIQSWVF